MSRDQRTCHRYSLPQGQDRALLRWWGRDLPIRLINVSANGFLLECPDLSIDRGQVLWMRTAAAWTQVRVVFMEAADEGLQLGVERVAELDETAIPSSGWWPFSWTAPQMAASGGAGTVLVGVGVMVAIVLGVVLLQRTWMGTHLPERGQFSRSLSSLEWDVPRAVSRVGTALGRFVPTWPSRRNKSTAEQPPKPTSGMGANANAMARTEAQKKAPDSHAK